MLCFPVLITIVRIAFLKNRNVIFNILYYFKMCNILLYFAKTCRNLLTFTCMFLLLFQVFKKYVGSTIYSFI